MTFARDLQRLEILSGPEYFDCVTLRCRMRRQACAERWRKARQLTADGIYDDHRGRLLVCRECVTGRANAEQAAPTETPAHRRAVIREQKRKERSDRMPKKQTKTPRAAGETPWRKPCVNCHRVMAIVREGLCGLCARAAHKKTGAERDEALKQARQDAIRLAARAASREANRIFEPGSAQGAEAETPDAAPCAPPPEKTSPPPDDHAAPPPDLLLHMDNNGPLLPNGYPEAPPIIPREEYATGIDTILLHFFDGDLELLQAIRRHAEYNRRSVDNEIIFNLNNIYLPNPTPRLPTITKQRSRHD